MLHRGPPMMGQTHFYKILLWGMQQRAVSKGDPSLCVTRSVLRFKVDPRLRWTPSPADTQTPHPPTHPHTRVMGTYPGDRANPDSRDPGTTRRQLQELLVARGRWGKPKKRRWRGPGAQEGDLLRMPPNAPDLGPQDPQLSNQDARASF